MDWCKRPRMVQTDWCKCAPKAKVNSARFGADLDCSLRPSQLLEVKLHHPALHELPVSADELTLEHPGGVYQRVAPKTSLLCALL